MTHTSIPQPFTLCAWYSCLYGINNKVSIIDKTCLLIDTNASASLTIRQLWIFIEGVCKLFDFIGYIIVFVIWNRNNTMHTISYVIVSYVIVSYADVCYVVFCQRPSRRASSDFIWNSVGRFFLLLFNESFTYPPASVRDYHLPYLFKPKMSVPLVVSKVVEVLLNVWLIFIGIAERVCFPTTCWMHFSWL